MRFLAVPHLDDTAKKVFEAYNAFVALLNSKSDREYIKKLSLDATWEDGRYQEFHQHTRVFHEGLIELFFYKGKSKQSKKSLGELTRHYGVF